MLVSECNPYHDINSFILTIKEIGGMFDWFVHKNLQWFYTQIKNLSCTIYKPTLGTIKQMDFYLVTTTIVMERDLYF